MKEKLKLWATEFKYFISSKIFLKNFAGMLGVVIGTIILIFLFIRLFTRHNSHITVPSYVGKTVEQAKGLKSSRHIKIILIDSAAYNEDLAPGEIVSQDPSPESQAKRGRNVYVTINPISIPLTDVPRIWDLQLSRAETILARAKFRWTITRRPDRAVNTILEVQVKNGNKTTTIKPYRDAADAPKVPQGTELILVVAESGGVDVQIPYLTCLTYSEAMRVIRSNNLGTGALTILGNVSDTANAYVTRQYPSAFDGLPIKTGDPIDLWLQVDKPANCNDDDVIENNDGGEY